MVSRNTKTLHGPRFYEAWASLFVDLLKINGLCLLQLLDTTCGCGMEGVSRGKALHSYIMILQICKPTRTATVELKRS